jgi:hypothetical protein
VFLDRRAGSGSPVATSLGQMAASVEGETCHPLTGEAGMFDALFVLTLFGLLYVDIIEFLEKCERPHA